MDTGLAVLVVVAVAAIAFGVWRRRTDGRLRPAADHRDRLDAADIGAPLGDRATLVQFSTVFCQPCVGTRRVLGEIASMVPGVVHVDVDAESNLELVRRLDVVRTPTVLVLDAGGTVVRRASGAPRKADVVAALGEAIPSDA